MVSYYSVPQFAAIKVLSNLHREDIVAKSSKGCFIVTLADAFIRECISTPYVGMVGSKCTPSINSKLSFLHSGLKTNSEITALCTQPTEDQESRRKTVHNAMM